MNLYLPQKIATLAGVGSIVFLVGALVLANFLTQHPTQLPTLAASVLNFYQDGQQVGEIVDSEYPENGLYTFENLSLCNDGNVLKQARVTHWLANLTEDQKALVDKFEVSNESYHNLYPGSVGNKCIDFDVTIQMKDAWGEDQGQLELLVAAQEPFQTVGFLSIKIGTPTATPTPTTPPETGTIQGEIRVTGTIPNGKYLKIQACNIREPNHMNCNLGIEQLLTSTQENSTLPYTLNNVPAGDRRGLTLMRFYYDSSGTQLETIPNDVHITAPGCPEGGVRSNDCILAVPTNGVAEQDFEITIPEPSATPTPTTPACPTIVSGCKVHNLSVTNVDSQSVSISWAVPICEYDRFVLDVADIAEDNIVCTIRDLAKNSTQATCTLPSGESFTEGKTYHVNLRTAKWGTGCWSDEFSFVPFTYTGPPPPPTATPNPGVCTEAKPENPISLDLQTQNCNNQVTFRWQAGGDTPVQDYAVEIETSAIGSPPWSSAQQIWRGTGTSTEVHLGFPDTFNRDRRWRVVAYSPPTGCAHGRTEAPVFRINCTAEEPPPGQPTQCLDDEGSLQNCSAAGDPKAGTVYGQCCAIGKAKSVHRICGESHSDHCSYECLDLSGNVVNCGSSAACVHNAPSCPAAHIGKEIKLPSQGDVNGPEEKPDGIVNGYDASVLIRAWGSKIGEEKYDPEVDLNRNGENDALDASIMVSNWGE